MGTRWARFVRGTLAALVSTFAAACSHTVAGGTPPSVIGLALCLAFSAMLCVLLAGKTVSLPRLAWAIGLSQFAFHGAFSLLTDARAPASGLVTTITRHAHGELHSFAALSPAQVMPGHAAMPSDPTMWLGHAFAALLTITAVRYGEGAFWSVIRIGRMAIDCLLPALPLGPFLPGRQLGTVAGDRTELPRTTLAFLSALRHRGPPAAAAAF